MRNILLCSGGLDSTVLAFQLASSGERFIPLFVNYGQHCAATELETLRSVLPPSTLQDLRTLDLSSVYQSSSSRLIVEADLWRDQVVPDDLYLPFRNLLLLSAAAAFAQTIGAARVYVAMINTARAEEIDCSAEFFDRLREVMAIYGAVEVLMPFREMTKAQVAELGIALGAPVALTYSCQAAARVPCGACPNCVERLEALQSLELSRV